MSRPQPPRRDAPVRDAEGSRPGSYGDGGAAVAEGIVRELLPSELVRVELDGRHHVTAHLASPERRNFVRVLVGDRVRVAVSAQDPTRGRVVGKL